MRFELGQGRDYSKGRKVVSTIPDFDHLSVKHVHFPSVETIHQKTFSLDMHMVPSSCQHSIHSYRFLLFLIGAFFLLLSFYRRSIYQARQGSVEEGDSYEAIGRGR